MELVPNDDGSLTVLGKRLTTAQVDDLVHGLLQARSEMKPAVAMSLTPDHKLLHVDQPAFAVGKGLSHIVLAVRHPGAGWLGLMLDERAAALMASSITKRLSHDAVDRPLDEISDPGATKH